MIGDNFFMVIPVYRLDQDSYLTQMKADFEKLVSASWDGNFREENPELVEDWRQSHRTSYGGGWEFNETIGFIKLFFMGSQVRGEYWSTQPRRKVRTRKKLFEFKALKLAPESEVWERTNSGVLNAVEEYLVRCQKELKGRFLDVREFESLKDHIDWLSLYITKNVFA